MIHMQKTKLRFGGPLLVLALGFGAACTQSSAKLNYVFKDAPKPGIVAKIGTTKITKDELLNGEARINFIELKKKEYDLKLKQLNNNEKDRLNGAKATK